jgi:hypothetical protein
MKSAFLLMFLIVGCMFSSSWAETTPNSSVDDTETPPEGQGTEGDPVGVIDGSVLDAAVDLRVECPGIDLVFKRAYGSWSTRYNDWCIYRLCRGWCRRHRLFVRSERQCSSSGNASNNGAEMKKICFLTCFWVFQIIGWGVILIEIFNPERSIQFIICTSVFLCYLFWLRRRE